MLLGYYKDVHKVNSTYEHAALFYTGLLSHIFRTDDCFAVKSEVYTNLGNPNSTKADLSVLFTVADRQENIKTTRRILMCEVKRQGNDLREAAWSDTLKQVSAFAGAVRAHEKQAGPQPSIYITLNSGTHLRFYEMPSGEEDAIEWAPAHGRLFELADDEAEVSELLQQMRESILGRQS